MRRDDAGGVVGVDAVRGAKRLICLIKKREGWILRFIERQKLDVR